MGSILITNKDGKKYELCYSRASLVKMEKEGFDLSKVDKEPLSQLTILLRGSFYKNNPSLSYNEIDEIIDNIENVNELTKALLELYSQCLMALAGQSSEPKNFKWEKN